MRAITINTGALESANYFGEGNVTAVRTAWETRIVALGAQDGIQVNLQREGLIGAGIIDVAGLGDREEMMNTEEYEWYNIAARHAFPPSA